jgi:prolyl-tRNA editing enzyme YbaK/EbsC (Cys-tRNA(Pro) deacylase)
VPPTGFPAPIPTFIDRDLLRYPVVWAAAGTPRHVFPIAPQDLVRITGGRVADLAVDHG